MCRPQVSCSSQGPSHTAASHVPDDVRGRGHRQGGVHTQGTPHVHPSPPPRPFSLSRLPRLPPPQKLGPDGKPTVSAHPARFSPDDKFSRVRVFLQRGGLRSAAAAPSIPTRKRGPLTCSVTAVLAGTDSVQEAVRLAAHTEASAAAMRGGARCIGLDAPSSTRGAIKRRVCAHQVL